MFHFFQSDYKLFSASITSFLFVNIFISISAFDSVVIIVSKKFVKLFSFVDKIPPVVCIFIVAVVFAFLVKTIVVGIATAAMTITAATIPEIIQIFLLLAALLLNN
jgi:hypothetical protein